MVRSLTTREKSKMMEAKKFTELYVRNGLAGIAKLDADSAEYTLPDDELAERAIRGCLNSRSGKWRKTKPAKCDDAKLLWELVRFHQGSGNLWGYPHFAEPVLRDKLDTLALVLLAGHSAAANAWQYALGSS